jgi:predicted phosphate transport protein (TIGR00153 family)
MKLSLKPKSERFFILFDKAGANMRLGSAALVELVNNWTDVETKRLQIKEIEHIGDQLTHETVDALNKTFITPIDREDIYSLITTVDDVLDYIDGLANRLVLYKVTPNDRIRELCAILQRSVEEVASALEGLRAHRKPEEILKRCVEINRLENEADDALRSAIADLFENEKDAIQIIKWKEIYEVLETATDKCEDVANVIESILVKNA